MEQHTEDTTLTQQKNKKDYRNAKIYCIRNTENDLTYIGSTTQKLSRRMAEHRTHLNCEHPKGMKLYEAMRELGRDTFYIELIENYECNNLEELRKREGELIRQHKPDLNKNIAGRTPDEYRNENRDNILKQKKQYNENNRDKIKQYYQNNKERIQTYQQAYYKQADKEKANARSREVYLLNKETILLRRKELRDLKKSKEQQTVETIEYIESIVL